MLRGRTTLIFAALGTLCLIVVAGVACVLFRQPAAQLPQADRSTTSEEQAIAAEVNKALSGPTPMGYAPIPPATRLLSVRVQGTTVTFDFSKALLSNGTGAQLEDAIHQIFVKVGNVTGRSERNYRVLVEGVPLEQLLKK